MIHRQLSVTVFFLWATRTSIRAPCPRRWSGESSATIATFPPHTQRPISGDPRGIALCGFVQTVGSTVCHLALLTLKDETSIVGRPVDLPDFFEIFRHAGLFESFANMSETSFLSVRADEITCAGSAFATRDRLEV